MLKALLVDDEILALNLLEAMLQEIGGIGVAGKFTSPAEGLRIAETIKPDILFLDIEMPELSGIQVAERVEMMDCDAEIVFVTAYDQYAIEAFNVQAVDYVLKPIDKNRLRKTVERIAQRRQRGGAKPDELSRIKFGLLGSFRLIDQHNNPVKWRTKKVKELCAYLIHRNEPVHRDKIMEDLWPGQSPDKAAALAHTTVYQLRKELKSRGYEDTINYEDERYSFVLEADSDVQEIKEIMKQEPGLSDDDEIKRLLEIYKDNYLAEEDYSWSLTVKEQLRKAVIHYLERALLLYRQSDFTGSLLREILEKLNELDPWEESYIAELIQYLIGQGDRREALRVFENYRATLWQQLGEEPQKRLTDLIDNL